MQTVFNNNLTFNKKRPFGRFFIVEIKIQLRYYRGMKQLSDDDILQMAGVEYTPDDTATKRAVRSELKLSKRIPPAPQPTPKHIVLDLHNKTVEQAWGDVMSVAQSGAATANIITGASGVLRQLFPQWARESVLSPHIVDFQPINNGSFFVRFHHKNTGK